MNVAFTVPASTSVTVTLLIVSEGAASLSTIVPTPWLSAIVALVGPDRFTANVSSNSSSVSPRIATVTGRVVWPAVNVTVPVAAL